MSEFDIEPTPKPLCHVCGCTQYYIVIRDPENDDGHRICEQCGAYLGDTSDGQNIHAL